MVNLKQAKSKNGFAITAYTDNNKLLQAWKKKYPKSALVSGQNGNGIKFSVDKKYLKSKETLNDYLQPLYATAEEFGENFSQNDTSNVMSGENFMEKYETLNQKFQAHLGDLMKSLIEKGEIDEKTAQRLIMGYVPHKGVTYGLNFGGTNPLFILFQDEDATYVATEMQWLKRFNRVVIDKSKPIYIKTNTDDGVDVENALKNFGLNQGDKMNSHQKASAHKNLSRIETNGEQLGNAIAYDVRFTEVIEGKEDLFNQEEGLESNIYGKENKAAISARKENPNNQYDNTYDDTVYRQINVQNTNDIRKNSKVMTSNINYFLKMNKWGDIANATNFRQALLNLLEYEVNRDTNVQDKETTKKVAYAFLSSYFNVWQDGSVKSNQLSPNTYFNTKREYRACFYVIRQSCDVILGRNFGLKGVTREEVETMPQPQTITNVSYPSIDDFLNFMGVDKNELAKKSDDEPLLNQQENENKENDMIANEEINHLKESFFDILNKLMK